MVIFCILQVSNPDNFPEYAYRDDGMLLHTAIKTYVSTIVENIYGKKHSATFLHIHLLVLSFFKLHMKMLKGMAGLGAVCFRVDLLWPRY